MKRRFFYPAALALTFIFGACSDDTPEEEQHEATFYEQPGVFVVNEGNQGYNLPGGLSFYNSVENRSVDDCFSLENGISVGDTPNSAYLYNGRLYVAVTESNLIWVINAADMKVEKSITFDENYSGPRYITSAGGALYATLFSGHVARIDAATNTVDKIVKVGPNPEGIAFAGNKLYVANSDGLNWMAGYSDSSMSVITLPEMTVSSFDAGINPRYVRSNGKDVFVCCMGDYSPANPPTLRKIDTGTLKVSDICQATCFDVTDSEIYAIYSNWDTAPADRKYSRYSTDGRYLGELTNDPVDYPTAVYANADGSRFVILSQRMSSGYADYSTAGYGRLYDKGSNTYTDFEAGFGPSFAVVK